MQLLVGDIGGTKSLLAIAEVDGGRVHLAAEQRYSSTEFGSLQALVACFRAQAGVELGAAVLAVAGPVHRQRSEITNLPWDLDARSLERVLGLERVRLLNDLEAVAWGIAALGPDDLMVLHPGDPEARGNACVVAAGTGLGEAGLYWDGCRHRPFATEGGHADFAPKDARELALLLALQARYGHVSWERLVSGMGIADIYRFLLDYRGARGAASLQEATATVGDACAAIAAAATAGSCPLCVETMELFMELYGREAGNMALKHMAAGGVYLAGGIAPKNLDLLVRGPFLRAFFDKGRMADLMARMPVKVVLEQRAPLIGAARFFAAS